VNVEQIIENSGGDRELVVSIVRIFLKRYRDIMAEIQTSIENSDAEKMWRAAHTMKGTVSYFLVDEILSRVKEIERIGRTGTVDGTLQIFNELSSFMDQLVASLTDSFLGEKQ